MRTDPTSIRSQYTKKKLLPLVVKIVPMFHPRGVETCADVTFLSISSLHHVRLKDFVYIEHITEKSGLMREAVKIRP